MPVLYHAWWPWVPLPRLGIDSWGGSGRGYRPAPSARKSIGTRPRAHRPPENRRTPIADFAYEPVAAEAGPGPELSIVIASIESGSNLARALEALREACGGVPHEVIVVDASTDDSARIAEEAVEATRVVRYPPGTLTPTLWAEGIALSTGRWVALSTGHCVLPPGWAAALLAQLKTGADGVGAGLLPTASARALDRAVFFLRYSGFLDLTRGGAREVGDLPGDNAAYRGDDIRSFVAAREGGFWEIEYHEAVAARGGRLVAVPAATAGFGRSFPFSTIFRHRYRHGYHYGAWRVREGGQGLLRVLLPAPLVPLVLMARAMRAARRFGLARTLAASAPSFLALGWAWAAGEAAGALGLGGAAWR